MESFDYLEAACLTLRCILRLAYDKAVVVAGPKAALGVEKQLLHEVVRVRVERVGCATVEVSQASCFFVEFADTVAAGSHPQVAVLVVCSAGNEVVAEHIYPVAVEIEQLGTVGKHHLAFVESRNPHILLIVAEYIVDFRRRQLFEVYVVVLAADGVELVVVGHHAAVSGRYQVGAVVDGQDVFYFDIAAYNRGFHRLVGRIESHQAVGCAEKKVLVGARHCVDTVGSSKLESGHGLQRRIDAHHASAVRYPQQPVGSDSCRRNFFAFYGHTVL